jgi:hypothetical protein
MQDSMKIAVIGANGHTGRIVVKDALARGHQVVAVARTAQLPEPDDPNLTNARADVRDAGALTRALVGTDAVISALGVGASRAGTDLYSTGVSNTLAAMKSNGAAKLAVISGQWCAPTARRMADSHGGRRQIELTSGLPLGVAGDANATEAPIALLQPNPKRRSRDDPPISPDHDCHCCPVRHGGSGPHRRGSVAAGRSDFEGTRDPARIPRLWVRVAAPADQRLGSHA